MAKDFATALKLGNIPLINLRYDLIRWNRWIRSGELAREDWREPIRTPLLIWGGQPEDLLTLIVQRVILGAESYVPAAVWIELGKSGRLTPELNKTVRNPFSIKSNRKTTGTADRYYNLAPSILDPKIALEKAKPMLWDDVHEFYRTVRNKILHGNQIGVSKADVLYPIFDMFLDIHRWVDEWHDPNIGWKRTKAATP
jgi:hypothetical protein